MLNLKHALVRRERMLGRTVEILVEGANAKMPEVQIMGRTTQGFIVYCDGDIGLLYGKLVNVLIHECHTYFLSGEIVSS